MDTIEIIFDTFPQAMDIHKKLFQMLRKTGFVTYGDLLCMAQDENAVYPDKYYDYGWTELYYAKVEPAENYVNGEWALIMPKPKKLNIKKVLFKYKKEKELDIK